MLDSIGLLDSSNSFPDCTRGMRATPSGPDLVLANRI